MVLAMKRVEKHVVKPNTNGLSTAIALPTFLESYLTQLNSYKDRVFSMDMEHSLNLNLTRCFSSTEFTKQCQARCLSLL